MHIIVEKEAAEYIREKSNDNSLLIMELRVKSGWCSVNQLSVKMGRPDNEKAFNLYEVNGIDVYLLRTLNIPKDEVKISLKKILFIKNLEVKGVVVR